MRSSEPPARRHRAAHVQPFAPLERKAIGSPQSVQSVMAALEAHHRSKPCGVIP
jgi:hypothetical protein